MAWMVAFARSLQWYCEFYANSEFRLDLPFLTAPSLPLGGVGEVKIAVFV